MARMGMEVRSKVMCPVRRSLLPGQGALAILAVGVLGDLAGPAAASGQGEWKTTAGAEYTSGDYGQSLDTEVWYVPFALKYEALPWSWKVTVPWISIRGPGAVVGAGEGGIALDTSLRQTRKTESGLGDVVVAGTYSISPARVATLFVDLTAKVKFGTADFDKGLGTGEADLIVQVDVARTFGRFVPLGTLGYKFKGDPSGFDLDNVWFASAGFDYRVGPQVSSGLVYDWQDASTPTSHDMSEVTGYVNWRIDRTWSLITYGIGGLSDGSPAYGVGVQATARF